MEQPVLPLHHVHGHVGEAHVVLHEEGDGDHGLDHLVHQQELLGVLQVPLSQVHVGAGVDGATLGTDRQEGHVAFNCVASPRMAPADKALSLNDLHSVRKSKSNSEIVFHHQAQLYKIYRGFIYLFLEPGGRENHRGKTASSCLLKAAEEDKEDK